MANIRGKIYYDKLTGNIITQIPEQQNSYNVRESTVEEDFQSLIILKERVPETVGVILLEIGDYATDFAEATLIGINPETKELKFEYPNPEDPDVPIIPSKPLSKQIEDIQTSMDNAVLELTMLIAMGGM